MSKDNEPVYTVESLLKRTQQIHKEFQNQGDQDSLVYFQALIICLKRIEKATAYCKDTPTYSADGKRIIYGVTKILEGGQDR